MGDRVSTSCTQRAYFKVLLFAGLLLSQTQILVNLKSYTSIYTLPYATLAYFILTSTHLGYAFAGYGFGERREKGAVLEWYQHIVLPLSVLLLSLLAKNPGLVEFKVTCSLLLTLQSLLVTGKIIYFNSVTPELAQISTINKLVRVVKLNVIGLLPLAVHTQLVVVVVVALCQAISLCAFFLKFTYQKIIYEYVLLVGVFSGFVSAVENVFETIFGLPYLFVGELAAIFFYVHENNYLRSALQLKYTSSLANTSQAKQDDQILAGLLFVEECLFQSKRTLELSETAKNEGAIQACTVLDRIRPVQLDSSIYDPVFQLQTVSARKQVSTGLFQAYCQRFHHTDSFSCFEFTVGSALQLGGSFTNKALILYYGFMERKKAKASVFETCKFHFLYQRILKQVQAKEADREDINFIEFSDNLRLLGEEIEECLANELKLIEYLADRSRKAEMMTDGRLFARNKLKSRIRARLDQCFSQGIYFCSNEFKFLFLLYHISVEKRYLNLREQLKLYFLASEVQRLRFQGSENSLVVLSGFNHGQIINSNEVFKNHFGLALSSFSRSNISQFIPSEKQRAKHASLMAQSVQFRRQEAGAPHYTYQCRLSIQRQFGSVKLKVVQSFSIGVRIYYQNSGAFNYICNLAPIDQGGRGNKETLTLLRRDCQNFSNKGVQFTVIHQTAIDQLDEHLQLNQIQFNYENTDSIRISNNQQMRAQQERKERPPRVQRYLQQKTARIEKKLLQEGGEEYHYTMTNVLQISFIAIFTIFIFVMMLSVGERIQNLKESIIKLVTPVTSAELVQSRVMLQQEILSLQGQTTLFPDNICAKANVPSIQDYITDALLQDLEDSTDTFITAVSIPHDFGQLGQNLYLRKFSSVPYLGNPRTTVSYQKYIQLLKSQTFSWLNTLHNSSFNYIFFSKIFPGIMMSSTVDGDNTLTTMLLKSQKAYVSDLNSSIVELRAIMLVLVGVLGTLVMIIRVRDSKPLMRYLGIVECIPPEQLSDRTRQLKSAISQLHQVRVNRIESIEFDRMYLVQLRTDKREPEIMPVEEFAEWHLRSKAEYEMDDSEGSYCDQDKEFLQHHNSHESGLARSEVFRLIFYKKVYLLIAGGLLVCIMALADSAITMQQNRLTSLMLCSGASLELSKIQQKFINLAAYNWLKVLSLQSNFDMTATKMMYNQALNSLMTSTYQAKLTLAYSKQISDQVLYGDVCGFFKNPQDCISYRNNILSSGFSMLIPFAVKEMVEIDQISSNYTYYLLNMCDKTWLLFDGIIPLTNNISKFAFNAMTKMAEAGFVVRFLEIAATIFVFFGITFAFQYRRYHRESIIKEEVFSLDTVQNLYSVTEFKPYFNKIYYS